MNLVQYKAGDIVEARTHDGERVLALISSRASHLYSPDDQPGWFGWILPGPDVDREQYRYIPPSIWGYDEGIVRVIEPAAET